MKQISLVKIRLCNFLSFQEEEIIFPQSYGFRLLTGKNNDEPSLGANGTGKTSMWEAICFALYGMGVKKKKLSGLLTWEEKQSTVILELLINGNKHIIKRFGPPMKIEFNGKPVEQSVIDELVNLSHERFIHSVIFGQGVKLFPDLDALGRINLFDEVLDLSIWSKCLEIATKKATEIESQIGKLKIDYAFFEGKLNALESEDYVKREIATWEIVHTAALAELDLKYNSWTEDTTTAKNELDTQIATWRQETIDEANSVADQVESLEKELLQLNYDYGKEIIEEEKQIGAIATVITINQNLQARANLMLSQYSEQEKLWTNSSCPSCNREITHDEKVSKLHEITNLKVDFSDCLKITETKITQCLADKEIHQRTLKELNNKQLKQELDVRRIQLEINSLKLKGTNLLTKIENDSHPYHKQLVDLSAVINPYFSQKKAEEEKINPFIQRLDYVTTERANLTIFKQEYETQQKDLEKKYIAATYWKSGFKRIRLFFVQQILDALQVEIKAAIQSLGLQGWSIKLVTEAENKSGGTKLGIQILVSSKTSEAPWEAWSGGESQRLRLAIAQGLGNLIQRAAGVWWDIEVWDEPTNFLDEKGIIDLLDCLYSRAHTSKKTIWLVDHRALQSSSFDEIWSITKTNKGSKVYKQ